VSEEKRSRSIEQHRGEEKDPDLVAKKNGGEIIIEMKRDSKAPDVDFGTCIYQLLRYIKGEGQGSRSGVSAKYRGFLENTEYTQEKLGIKAFKYPNKR